jgi:hypothetical protein
MILRQSAFRRSPLGAFIRSPLAARGRRRPTTPTRQLENACYRVYPWGNRLVIVGTFPERVCIYDGSRFHFPLHFDTAQSAYLPPGEPDNLTTETTYCQDTRDGWDVRAFGDKLVLAGHFTRVNGFDSPAGVICLDTDNVWRDYSDGLPTLDLNRGRHIRLICSLDSPLLIQWLNRDRSSNSDVGTPNFHHRWPDAAAWSAATVTTGAFVRHNQQGHWLTGDYAGGGRFPSGGTTWAIGRLAYLSYYDRWSVFPGIFNTTGTGVISFIRLGSLWVGVGKRVDRIYYDPTHYVRVYSGYLSGSGSSWISLPDQFLAIACPPTTHGGDILATSQAEVARWNRTGGTLDHYLWDPQWHAKKIVELVSWGADLYAGGFFQASYDSQWNYPLGLIRSSNFGEDWSALTAIPAE